MTSGGDAVATGLVASLAQPGGNITGSTFFVPKLKEALSRTERVAVLVNGDDPSHVPVLNAMKVTARSLKVEVQEFGVRGSHDFESAFKAMAKGRADAVVVQEGGVLTAKARAIADFAAKMRLPSAGLPAFAEAGGQIGYGVNPIGLSRRGAYFVDRIFNGAKPSDLPIERPTKFELIVNLKTAKASA